MRSRDRRRDPSRRGASSCRTSRTAGRASGPAAAAAVARAAATTRTVALRAAAPAGWRAAGSVRDGAVNPVRRAARRAVHAVDHRVHGLLDHGRAEVHVRHAGHLHMHRRVHRKLGKGTGGRGDDQYKQSCDRGGYCEPPPSVRSERASHGQLIGISTHKVKTLSRATTAPRIEPFSQLWRGLASRAYAG